MRRVLTTAMMVGLVMLLGSVTLPKRSVMAGVQQRLTPVVHAQVGGAYWDCQDLFDEFSELEFEGQYNFAITGVVDLGPVAYGVELMQYYGIWDGSPFSVNCYDSWF